MILGFLFDTVIRNNCVCVSECVCVCVCVGVCVGVGACVRVKKYVSFARKREIEETLKKKVRSV